MSCNKDGGDGKQVVCELTRSVFDLCVAVNHEFCASFFQDETDELQSIPTESVLVHDHNLCDQSAVYAFQKGLQTSAFEVEAGSDVGDNLVLRVRGLQVLDLSLQVAACFLRPGADSSVDDAAFRFWLRGGDAEVVFDGKLGVKALVTTSVAESSNGAVCSPFAKS